MLKQLFFLLVLTQTVSSSETFSILTSKRYELDVVKHSPSDDLQAQENFYFNQVCKKNRAMQEHQEELRKAVHADFEIIRSKLKTGEALGFFTAFIEDALVGFIYFKKTNYPNVARIGILSLDNDHYKKEIERALIRLAFWQLEKIAVVFVVDKTNKGQKKWLEHFGFEPSSLIIDNFDSSKYDVYLLRKTQ